MDLADANINVYVALTVIVATAGIAAVLINRIFTRVEKKSDGIDEVNNKMATLNASMTSLEKDMSALSARHDELSRTVVFNEKSLRDSAHDIRNLIGTNYVTRVELQAALTSIKEDMRNGFEDLKNYIKDVYKS